VTKLGGGSDGGPSPSKQSRTESSKKEDTKTANSNASDHLIALTQLRETIGNLQRQLAQKDKDLLTKDRQVRTIFYSTKPQVVFLNLKNVVLLKLLDYGTESSQLHNRD